MWAHFLTFEAGSGAAAKPLATLPQDGIGLPTQAMQVPGGRPVGTCIV